MKSINPSELTARERHQYILGTIGPRPIAFASTISTSGIPNLAPFSFFNVFSSSPPVLIFSTGIRVSDGSEKDTLRNIRETGEVVINLVDYNMVRQMAIAGIEYPDEVSEFQKSGLSPLPSQMVKPFRVEQSPAQYECRVLEIKPVGNSGNLIIAEALLIHIREDVFTSEGRIDPKKMDLVGRLGGFNYCRASGDSLFSVVQPHSDIALGFDALPESLRRSTILTGNELAMLAGVKSMPSQESIESFKKENNVKELLHNLPHDDQGLRHAEIHEAVRNYLHKGQVEKAWSLILCIS